MTILIRSATQDMLSKETDTLALNPEWPFAHLHC